LFGSLCNATQTPLQIVSPLTLHPGTHDVPLQLTVPPVGAEHVVQLGPHEFWSLVTHDAPQACWPVGQLPHTPLEQ
jgi:hypothetical protein